MLTKTFMDRVFMGTPYYLTSNFGERINPVTKVKSTHWGRDYGTHAIKCMLFSPVWGVVTRSEYNSIRGHFVEIKTPIGFVLMQHMSYRTVTVGQLVTNGNSVGACGTTGSSTGVHLHIEFYNASHQHVHPDNFIGGYADPVFQTYLVNTTVNLNVRNLPSLAGSVVSKLAPKSKVVRYAETNGWVKVRYTLPWWVSKKWLKLIG